MAQARPISEVVEDAGTDPVLREKLERATAIREFASRELALPDNQNYRSYADLGRPYVVWNVFAAPEFSLELQPWCMLFVGCVNYRGYYEQIDAERYASELGTQGLDTYVRGVPAYTTLGYFTDPLLNTFLRFGDFQVARIIFHELAHQIVYVQDDTTFNESFASAVENEGLIRWLQKTGNADQLRHFATQREHWTQFRKLVADTGEKLHSLYDSSLSSDDKRRAKSVLIAEMQQNHAVLKASGKDFGGFDAWFNQPLNNATLGSVSLYTKWVPAFQLLLEHEGGNLPRFYQRVTTLASKTKAERTAILEQLMAQRVAPFPRQDQTDCLVFADAQT